MGEAKRRKINDPNFGRSKGYMSYLELPYTKSLVTSNELRRMIKVLKKLALTEAFYATVLFDHIGRWKKIEKLCSFIGMQKILNHNEKFFGTESVFITRTFAEDNKKKLLNHYTNLRPQPFSNPPLLQRRIVKEVLVNSQKQYDELVSAHDVKCIYKSTNCAAFHVPADISSLEGLHYVNFLIKLKF